MAVAKKPHRNNESNRRQELLRASARLFRQRGFDGTSIDDLAKRLGISKSAIYHHVEGKDAQGNAVRYAVEWGAGLQLNRQGVTRETLKPGDHVIITGNPGRNPEDHRLRMRTITRPSDGWKWGGTFD